MQTCVSYYDLINYPFCCNLVDQLCCSQENIQLNLDFAVEFIEAITNTNWCPEEGCKTFDGTGDCKLHFTPNTSEPLQSLTSVTQVGCNICGEATLLPENECNWLEFTCGGTFPCGQSNIQVCGMWGEPLPEGVKRAIILLALETSQPGITGLDSATNVEEIEWTDLKISYDNSIIDGSDFTTGFIQIDRMLKPYIPTSSQIGFSIVGSDCPDCCQGDCEC